MARQFFDVVAVPEVKKPGPAWKDVESVRRYVTVTGTDGNFYQMASWRMRATYVDVRMGDVVGAPSEPSKVPTDLELAQLMSTIPTLDGHRRFEFGCSLGVDGVVDVWSSEWVGAEPPALPVPTLTPGRSLGGITIGGEYGEHTDDEFLGKWK